MKYGERGQVEVPAGREQMLVTTKDPPPVRIAVDIGGTFTDLQIFDARTGAITSLKTPTTPEDPSIGLMTGIKEAARARRLPAGATSATCCTAPPSPPTPCSSASSPGRAGRRRRGFEDVLEIGRHYRREIYALNPQVPPALIPRDRRIGIEERIRAGRQRRGAADEQRALEGLVAKLDALDVDDGRDLPAQFVHQPASTRARSPSTSRRPGPR